MSICCEDVPVDSAPSSDKEVGIDIGLKICADLSDGTTIENPRFFRQEEKNLAKAQRKRDKAPKKSKERTQLHKRVARVHERTKNRRGGGAGGQTCSCCGHRQEMPLSVRMYECPVCGLVIDRDHNGSRNILEDAVNAVGRHSRDIRRAPPARQPWGVVTPNTKGFCFETISQPAPPATATLPKPRRPTRTDRRERPCDG